MLGPLRIWQVFVAGIQRVKLPRRERQPFGRVSKNDSDLHYDMGERETSESFPSSDYPRIDFVSRYLIHCRVQSCN